MPREKMNRPANLAAGKLVNLKLIGLNGNAWALLDTFSHHAKLEGWSQEDIDAVCDAAMSGDYEDEEDDE